MPDKRLKKNSSIDDSQFEFVFLRTGLGVLTECHMVYVSVNGEEKLLGQKNLIRQKGRMWRRGSASPRIKATMRDSGRGEREWIVCECS